METDLSLAAPRADERAPRPPSRGQKQPQRKRAPKQHHASEAHGRAHAKQGHGARARDAGDRRDRKGNAVWSNSAPPPKYRKQRKPQR
jgi:hypothetical protein